MQPLTYFALFSVVFLFATPKAQQTKHKPNAEIWDTTTVTILIKTADTVFPEPPPRASLSTKFTEQVMIKRSHHKGAIFRKATQKHLKKQNYKTLKTIPTRNRK